MKKLSKILVLVLAVTLICAGFIMSASAEEPTKAICYYAPDDETRYDCDTLFDAYEDAPSGSTIYLEGKITQSDLGFDGWGIKMYKELTLYLQRGCVLELSDFTADRIFDIREGGHLTIMGNGTINAKSMLIFNMESDSGAKVMGDPEMGPMTINWTCTNTSQWLLGAQYGNYEFENVIVNVPNINGDIFKANNSSCNMSFKNVTVNATSAATGNCAVFALHKNGGTLSLDNCEVTTNGHSIIGFNWGSDAAQANKIENWITINESTLTAQGTDSRTSLLYSSYCTLKSDILIKNSNCTWNHADYTKHNAENSAVIFDNSHIVFTGTNNQLFRGLNLKLINGSSINCSDPKSYIFMRVGENTGLMTVEGSTNVQLLIEEGCRFDENTYNKLISNKAGSASFNSGAIAAYPDGSDVCSSTTYKMIYDPDGNAETPYVVLSAENAAFADLEGLKANLSLYSDFLVNLYIPAAYAQYITTVNEKALAEGTVNFGDAAEFVKATVAKNANEASDDAVFEIKLNDGERTATKIVRLSITDYATKILAGDTFADTDKALMYYMLNYANEVAKYPDGSADAEIAALLETYVQWNVVDVAKNFGNAVADKGLDSVFSYAGITLEAAPAFTFTPNGKFTGTVTVTYGDGNVREYTVPENSEAKILVEGMKIYNFATNITVTAVGTIAGVDGEQTVTGTINLDTYAKYHTENAANDESATKADSAAALDLINALYDYVKVAEQYKAGTLEIPTVDDGGEATPEPAPAE